MQDTFQRLREEHPSEMASMERVAELRLAQLHDSAAWMTRSLAERERPAVEALEEHIAEAIKVGGLQHLCFPAGVGGGGCASAQASGTSGHSLKQQRKSVAIRPAFGGHC
jgi:hypothetical protein